MSYSIELLSLLNLELNTKYSIYEIYDRIKKKKVLRGKCYIIDLWKLDRNFLALIMNYKLIGTNNTFYLTYFIYGE